jgi:hypothetical protein
MKDVIAMVEESAKSLATYQWLRQLCVWACIACSSPVSSSYIYAGATYLSYSPDVLVPVLL